MQILWQIHIESQSYTTFESMWGIGGGGAFGHIIINQKLDPGSFSFLLMQIFKFFGIVLVSFFAIV